MVKLHLQYILTKIIVIDCANIVILSFRCPMWNDLVIGRQTQQEDKRFSGWIFGKRQFMSIHNLPFGKKAAAKKRGKIRVISKIDTQIVSLWHESILCLNSVLFWLYDRVYSSLLMMKFNGTEKCLLQKKNELKVQWKYFDKTFYVQTQLISFSPIIPLHFQFPC